MSEEIKIGKRWSGSEWAEETKNIIIIGQGGIGSWLSLCLSRIEHRLYIVDPDVVDTTNVQGGQMFRMKDIGVNKVDAISRTCRSFGCTSDIIPIVDFFTEGTGMLPILMTGLDNMAARKLAFKEWKKLVDGSEEKENYILIDGRLNLEDYEILCVQGDRPEQIEEYERDFLFDDEEVPDAECTAKQTTYTAMGIASFMTAMLCNWLTNRKLGMQFRDVPFHTRVYYPAMLINMNSAKLEVEALAI